MRRRRGIWVIVGVAALLSVVGGAFALGGFGGDEPEEAALTSPSTTTTTELTELAVVVDMRTLRSDDDRRDGQLAERGLETDTFGDATFNLQEPIDLGETPAPGETITADANGILSMHGVTNEVTVPVEAMWDGDAIEAVASFDVALADYGIEPPVGSLVLSIEDTRTVETHLLFVRG